jgi:hypothetical protein
MTGAVGSSPAPPGRAGFAIGPRALAILSLLLAPSACGEAPTPPLPPLLEDATTTGGSIALCEADGGVGSTPDTASHSPEIVARLKRAFPPGSAAADLRRSLRRQGFALHDRCSRDGSVSWAEFRQRGGDGVTSMAALGTVFWREDPAGRLVWTTGDIAFRGL